MQSFDFELARYHLASVRFGLLGLVNGTQSVAVVSELVVNFD